MPNANYNSVEMVKRAALSVVEASNPVNILFGTVISSTPLKINVEQKLTLGEKRLILSRNVTDYSVAMTVDHTTENHSHTHTIEDTYTGSGSASMETHNHEYKGTKTFRVHNALKSGEKVILIRVQGGQKYLVFDRLGV